ncbi:hypothetical protein WJX72_008091 [[Myrmecia] bisecta]|uniref:Uncharacterized protein n=1 Tax=[Myrmecia] bisecta TaxID=41462 RepID=A0AAW1Q0V6_9CHLO
MINVGLRGYLWDKKPREAKVARELWTCNSATYHDYRGFIGYAKEYGFPDQQLSRMARRVTNDSVGSVEPSDMSFASSMASFSSGPQPVPYHFAGMKQIFDDSKVPVTVVCFGRLSSDLLAWGTADGVVRVAIIGDESYVMHEFRRHTRAVTEIDWTLDNSCLLTSSLDGTTCMWLANSGRLARTFTTESGALSCRFHQVNQNLIMVGTAAGEVEVFNCSTGMSQGYSVLYSAGYPEGLGACAMCCSNNMLYVGDTQGNVHSYRCDIKDGVLQALSFLGRTVCPTGKPAEVSSLMHTAYCVHAKGPGLLLSSANNSVCILKPLDAAGKLEVVAKAQMPIAARKIKAIFCPTLNYNEPEYIAMGGEDTGVYVYDITRKTKRGPTIVNKLQGHLAPVVDVSWSYDECLFASCDCDGVVIVWKRDKGMQYQGS